MNRCDVKVGFGINAEFYSVPIALSTDEIHISQVGAPERKSQLSDTGYTVWNYHALKAVAAIENNLSDDGQAVWKRNAGQAGAVIEGLTSDAGYAVRNYDTCQIFATKESVILDTGDAIWNGNGGQLNIIQIQFAVFSTD